MKLHYGGSVCFQDISCFTHTEVTFLSVCTFFPIPIWLKLLLFFCRVEETLRRRDSKNHSFQCSLNRPLKFHLTIVIQLGIRTICCWYSRHFSFQIKVIFSTSSHRSFTMAVAELPGKFSWLLGNSKKRFFMTVPNLSAGEIFLNTKCLSCYSHLESPSSRWRVYHGLSVHSMNSPKWSLTFPECHSDFLRLSNASLFCLETPSPRAVWVWGNSAEKK